MTIELGQAVYWQGREATVVGLIDRPTAVLMFSNGERMTVPRDTLAEEQ